VSETWQWSKSIGLWYGTAPWGAMTAVVRPVMTSPWWVLDSDHGHDTDLVRIFPSSSAAKAAAEHEIGMRDRPSVHRMPESGPKRCLTHGPGCVAWRGLPCTEADTARLFAASDGEEPDRTVRRQAEGRDRAQA
jgi:hypothetical protein